MFGNGRASTRRALYAWHDVLGVSSLYSTYPLDLDPGFAESKAELAIALLIGYPREERTRRAKRTVDTALELRPCLSRALAARGLVLQQHPSDWAASEAGLRVELGKNPNMVDALNRPSTAIGTQGDDDEPVALLMRAAQLGPLHQAIAVNVSWHCWNHGDLECAKQTLLPPTGLPEPGNSTFLQLRASYKTVGQLLKMNAAAKRQALNGSISYSLALNYPRYQVLMDRVGTDVDHQRAEVERLDVTRDLPALQDSVRAARK